MSISHEFTTENLIYQPVLQK